MSFKLYNSRFLLVDGILYRRSSGKPPGITVSDGYASVKVDGKKHRRGRIVLILKLGRDIREGFTCYHEDRNRLNDHADNLREATPQQQKHNSIGYSHDPEKYVRYEEDRKKWAAFAKKDNKKYRIGRYATKELALEARKKYLEVCGYRVETKS